jgi:hypothetical protein
VSASSPVLRRLYPPHHQRAKPIAVRFWEGQLMGVESVLQGMMHTEPGLARAMNDLAGRSVAVIGNAPELLEEAHGEEIDSLDVVIRFNGGPWLVPDHPTALGSRTTHWVKSNDALFQDAPTPCEVWWFTHVGWMACRGSSAFGLSTHMRYPIDRAVGAKASSGTVVLHLLSELAAPASVHAFGLYFWTEDGKSEHSSWHRNPLIVHQPALEREHVMRLGYRQIAPGRWTQ